MLTMRAGVAVSCTAPRTPGLSRQLGLFCAADTAVIVVFLRCFVPLNPERGR